MLHKNLKKEAWIKSKLPTYGSCQKALNSTKTFRGSFFGVNFSKYTKIPKFLLGGYFVVTLLGYQPILAIPPMQNRIARAEFSQEQNISSNSFSESFQLPHPGYLTTRFSSYHKGVDIATGIGMPVRAIMKGKVLEVNYGFFGYGHMVTIAHEQGLKSLYAHFGRIYVKKDQEVSKDTILGDVGMTGRTTGPHTHLEIIKGENHIDPLTVLPEIKNIPAPEAIAAAGKVERQLTATSGNKQLLATKSRKVAPKIEEKIEIDFKKELSLTL